MSDKVFGVLLVPDGGSGDPLMLLQEGPCGFRPPFAIGGHSVGYMCNVWRPGPSGGLSGENPRALVLAWAGKVVMAGVAVMQPHSDFVTLDYTNAVLAGHEPPHHRYVSHMAKFGTIVHIDEHGRELER